ncbi:type II secretion system F family protein [Streptomyces sp. NPDC048639]|uniref:type II secretion system F family protein n=1 Tax=Streptomyces sp. NPDC048639 TaxID=3365581 RepID=UPI003721CCBE
MTGGSGLTGGGLGVGAAPAYAAALCAGLAVWVLSGRDRGLRRARLLFAEPTGHAMGTGRNARTSLWKGAVARFSVRLTAWWGGRIGREVWCLPAGVAVALLGESPLPLPAAVAALPLVRRWLHGRERRRSRERTATGVIELCGVVAGELRAGQQPNAALYEAMVGQNGGAEVSLRAAARFGGDVSEALRKAARRPGAEGLLGVAACWQVAADGGAGLATGLERVAAALRAEREQREELHAQLAGTRSTAALLATLPLFGLLMGSALGAEPLRVLLHTPAGWFCLALGLLLEGAGLIWTAHIVRSAAGAGAGAGAERAGAT